MAFLGKIQFIEVGEKYCIKIDLQKIIKVFSVFAGKRISRAIAAGKSVHEGIEGTLDHGEEGVADRVLFTAAQGGVFQDMGDAFRVHGQGAQGNQEDVLRIVSRQVEMFGTGFVVLKFLHLDLQRVDGVAA